MKWNMISLYFVIFGAVANAATTSELQLGSHVESNTFYTDIGDRGDFAFTIKPKITHQSESRIVGFNFNADGSYNKYLNYANQDYFDFGGRIEVPVNQDGNFGLALGGDGRKISEPASSSTMTRPEYYTGGSDLKFHYRWSALSKLTFGGRYSLEQYLDKNHDFMSNNDVSGFMEYEYSFLPETVFFMSGMAGMKTYPNGKKNLTVANKADQIKYSSQYVEGRSGIRGRLAEKTWAEASGALQIRNYEKSSNFAEPVFNLKVEEQFGPKDLLIAGYDYEVSDSKFTNFVIDQTTYLGYARILGDQILVVSRVGYTYSSYSKPSKREDQRLAGRTRLDYSLSPTAKISVWGEMDLVNSDAINNVPARESEPDRSVSYEQIKAGMFVSFFF